MNTPGNDGNSSPVLCDDPEEVLSLTWRDSLAAMGLCGLGLLGMLIEVSDLRRFVSGPATPAADYVPPVIDINSATNGELMLLRGVGPRLSEQIVDDRKLHGPFQSVDELDRVHGIGPKLLAKNRRFLQATISKTDE